jgi:integrase
MPEISFQPIIATTPPPEAATVDITDDTYGRLSAVVTAWLANGKKATQSAYRAALRSLSRWICGAYDVDWQHGPIRLLSMQPESATATVIAYKQYMSEQMYSPNSIALHMRAIKSLSKFAFVSGASPWCMDGVRIPRPTIYKDTRGPGSKAVQSLVEACMSDGTARGSRDLCMILLNHDAGLRLSEICSLKYDDLDLEHGRILIQGKARDDSEYVDLPNSVVVELRRYLRVRLPRNDEADRGGSLWLRACPDGSMIHINSNVGIRSYAFILKKRAREAGVKHLSSHGLRHSGATAVARVTKSVFDVASYLRHSNTATAQVYVDRELGAAKTAREAAVMMREQNASESSEPIDG